MTHRRIARWLEVVLRALKSYGEHRGSLLAGGLTYYALVSLFPLTLFALSVAGFIWADPVERDALITNLLDNLPLDANTGRTDLTSLLESIVNARGTLGLLGLATAAYSGSALFSAIRRSLNQVFEVEDARPLVKGKLVDLALVAGFGLLLLASVVATFAIAFAARFATDVFGDEAATLARWGVVVANLLVPPFFSAVVFLLLYSKVAHAGVTWRQALGGTLFAAIGFELLKVGFAQYVAAFGNYDATYGTLGFIIILLFFFNLSAQLMLIGAELVRAGREFETDGVTREVDALRATVRRLLSLLPGRSETQSTIEGREAHLAFADALRAIEEGESAEMPAPATRAKAAPVARTREDAPPAPRGIIAVYALAVMAVVVSAVRRLRQS